MTTAAAPVRVSSKSTSHRAADRPSLHRLDEKQVGSLRHMGNLALAPKGDFSFMGGPADMMEDFGAPRFQYAYMAYALGLTHYNRLPAAPGFCKPTMRRLTEKMLDPDVWLYWRDISRGGSPLNKEAPMTEGWYDPVVKDNIMFSAYVQSMALMYNVLFNDDHFAQPKALTMEYHPIFWGDKARWEFNYDQKSLNDRVYWNMVESGYLGVACEPNCVFQVCNQPAILGFRLADHLYGTSTADEVTQGYVKAWEEFGGMLDAKGHFQTLVTTHNKVNFPGLGVWSDAWLGTLMNSWNPEFVCDHYQRQRDEWVIRRNDGLRCVEVSGALREHIDTNGAPELHPASTCNFGWMAVWAAEMGDTATVDGLLAYADQYFAPEYYKGGYFYPRQDEIRDDNGNPIANHPHQGNVLLNWARLNVKNGLRNFYSQPWGAEHFEEPALTGIDFGLDLYRADYDAEDRILRFDPALSAAHKKGGLELSGVFGRGSWTMTRDGEKVAWGVSDGLTGTSLPDEIREDGDTLKLDITNTQPAAYIVTWNR